MKMVSTGNPSERNARWHIDTFPPNASEQVPTPKVDAAPPPSPGFSAAAPGRTSEETLQMLLNWPPGPAAEN